jgi:hypothetical protein
MPSSPMVATGRSAGWPLDGSRPEDTIYKDDADELGIPIAWSLDGKFLSMKLSTMQLGNFSQTTVLLAKNYCRLRGRRDLEACCKPAGSKKRKRVSSLGTGQES